jgi:hypothetical protein
VLGSVVVPSTVRAATRTWDGGGLDNLWSNPLNWSADTLPVAADTVIFDGTSTKNVTINVPVTVAIVQVNAGYTGTITQQAGVTFSVTSSYTQSSGAFVGGTSGISVTGAFTVNSGGTFTSTAGTLTVTGAVTLGVGVFVHNSGTVVFSVSNVTLNLGGAATFNNVQFLSGTKTISAGNTMTVLGTLTLTAGAINTGTVAAAGDIAVASTFTGGTGTLLVNGGGAQTWTDAFAASADLPAVVINKGGGTLTMTGTFRTTHSWTWTAGTLNAAGSTVVFAGSPTITGTHTLGSVDLAGGTVTIAAGTTLNVIGTLNIASGALNTGTVAAQGDITAQSTFTGGGTGFLVINGAGAQTLTGFHTTAAGNIPAVDINKPSGSLTIAGTIRTARNWTYTAAPGGLVVAGSTVMFNGTQTITGSHALNNVEFRGATATIAAGTTLTVGGTLELFSGTLNQAAATGTVAAQGNVNARIGFTGGGTANLVLNGAGAQVFDGDHTVATGALPAVDVNKPSGSLTLTDTIRTGRNWTVTAVPGGITSTGSTLVFAGNLTITGSQSLNNVDIRSGTVVIAAGTTVTAQGNLNLFGGALNQAAATGVLAVQGNVDAQIGFTGGGSATVLLNGTLDQTLTGFHTTATGSLPNVELNKPSGGVTLAGTLRTGRNWTVTSVPGGLTVTGSTLVLAGNLTMTGSHTLNNIDIRSGTVVIAAGTTVTVAGTTELFGGALNQGGATGILAAQGNVNARIGFTGSGTATLLLNGTGDQVFDGDHNATTGSLPNVEINKPSGAVTLTDTLRTGRNWTYVAAPGGLTVTGSTLVLAGNLTMTGSHTLNNVDIRSGTVVIAAGTTVTASGTTELFGGALNQGGATGILAAQGNVNARIGFTGSGSATLLLNGAGDQVFDGDHNSTTGSLPHVEINKPSGAVTLTDTLRTGRNWTVTSVPGGLTVTGSTLVYAGNLTITGSHTLNNVEFRSGTMVIAGGTVLTVAGTTSLVDGDLNGGILEVHGDMSQAGTFDGETATIRIAGATDQVFTGTATSTLGDLPHLVIDKPAGTLHLVGTIRTNTVSWSWIQGTVDPGTSTVVFNGSTIIGSQALHHVELQGGTTTITPGDTLTVAGTTTLTDGDLNGGTLEAHGDIAILGTFDGETGILRIGGAGDQTLTGTATATTGDMANVVIDKPGGTLSLVGTVRLTTSSWTWLGGTIDPGTSVLVLDSTTTIAGSHTLNDIVLRGGAHTIGAGMPTAGGVLTLEDGTIDGGALGASGNVDQLSAFDGGTGTLIFTGGQDQTFSGAATLAAGDLPNVLIAKSGGTAFLAGTLRLNGASWTHAGGTVDPATSTVVFSGTSSIAAAGMSFADLTVNGGTTTLSQDLFVDGDLHVLAGTLNGAGYTATVGGDVTVDGALSAAATSLTLNGGAPQTLGGATAAIGLDDLRVTNATGVSTATEVQVGGTLTLLGPLDFSGQTLGIANPIAGTLTNLTADGAASLEVGGTASGIVIPASLAALGNLSLDNPTGADLAGDIAIGQTMTLTNGILGARPWTVTIGPAGSVVRTAGHVDGALEKTVPLGAGVAVTYEVGDATTYAPVTTTFGMVLWSSTLTAETTAGEHPYLGPSGIAPTADVNRWWTLTNNGILFDSVDATFTWDPSDVDSGANPAMFVVGKCDGTWTLPASTPPIGTSITAVGMTSFSDFAVGELEEVDGGLPDTSGSDGAGVDAALRALLVSALLIGLVSLVVVLARRRNPSYAADTQA